MTRWSTESLRTALEERTEPAAAALVRPEPEGMLRCVCCGNRCLIGEGESGTCRVRTNRGGVLRVPWGYVAGLQVDPIEKKPFFHVLPGAEALSFGMVGCNLHCDFCQNWVSSQALRDPDAGVPIHTTTADDLVYVATAERTPVIVSTYNEPLITSDWAAEVFRRAKARGLLCGYVSNGNASPEVLEFLRPVLDLFKVDLKTMDPGNYRALGCDIRNVLNSIERIHSLGFWMEIVTLVVPGFNDSTDELRRLAGFIANVSPDIPWHVTAFHPDYRRKDARRTSAEDLDRAYETGREAGLHFVYAGNLPGAVGDRESTHCPDCGAVLVRRVGFRVQKIRLKAGSCPDCTRPIPGVWRVPTYA